MPYGLKYQTQFTSVSDDNNPSRDYTLKFLFKDYAGEVATLTGGGTTVIQRCTVDEPNAAIKGQSLDIRLINEGNIPISSFQSEDDDGVQVQLLDENSNILFIGFLVQDDFYEGMVDFGHEITLSATDSLGLLKGVILSDADVRRSFYAVRQTNGVDTVVYVYVESTAFYPQAGDTIEIGGGTYIIDTAVKEDTVISSIGYNWTITTTTTTGGIAYGDETIYLTGEVNLLQRNSLLSIIACCLGQTNLPLVLNIFLNIYEYRQDNTLSTLDQTLIDSQTFITGETYLNCYETLTRILTTFRCTLFQANGCWNIVCWDEARKVSNSINAFVYDETFAFVGTDTFSNVFNVGPEPELTQPEYELVQGGVRGYKFSRKQFNYVQPKYLLQNYDLQILGDLIAEYQSAGRTYKEYVATFWEGSWSTPACTRFIRVVYDTATGNELERYIVARGTAFDDRRAVAGTAFEVNENDKLNFSFAFRTNISQPGLVVTVFTVQLFDGSLYRYVDELPVDNGDWLSTLGFSYSVDSGDNTNQWHNVEIISSPVPFTGLVTCYLSIATALPANNSRETHYKDIRLTVTPAINDTSKITGHIHKQVQGVNKKSNSDLELSMDDSPRNSIAGTLFLDTKTGLVQDRTTAWRYPADANGWVLGELTTLDELTWRQKTRAKFEGGFNGLWQNSVPASLLTLARMSFTPTKNYTFGLLTVDYKNNRFDGTLWELYDDNDPAFDPDYTFNYIYSTT